MDHSWEFDEETKILIGEYFIEVIKDSNRSFPADPVLCKKELERAGLTVNPKTKKISVHQSTIEHMHIALPPKPYVERALEQAGKPGYKYRPPVTYCEICDDSSTLEERQRLVFRIGDYTLSHCY